MTRFTLNPSQIRTPQPEATIQNIRQASCLLSRRNDRLAQPGSGSNAENAEKVQVDP